VTTFVKWTPGLIPTLLFPLLAACGVARDRDPTGYPRRTINIMAPAAPGGGWDQTARAMQSALAATTGQPAQVYNVPGAGGTLGLAQFINDQAGDPHQLMIGGLVMLGATVTNQSPVALEQVTPIAALTVEWEAIVAPANSPYQTFPQLLAAFKANPASISWGGGSAGGVDHILVGLIARAAGVEPAQINYVAHAGGGEALAALLSGAVTVGVASVSEFREQAQAGKLRWLAVSGDQPITGMDVPTIKEAGLEVVLPNWRAVFAPPRLNGEQRDAIIRTIEKMRATPEWQRALEKYGWHDFFKTGAEFDGFLKEEWSRIQAAQIRGGGGVIGPRFFPLVVAVGLLALSILFVLRTTVWPDEQLAAQAAAESAMTHWPAVGLTVAALLAYAWALGTLGYIMATALFFPLVARVLGSRRTARDVIIGVVLSVVIYYGFTRLLGVRLPVGLLDLIS
jgi:putative tricarboxylic transport membrane protein